MIPAFVSPLWAVPRRAIARYAGEPKSDARNNENCWPLGESGPGPFHSMPNISAATRTRCRIAGRHCNPLVARLGAANPAMARVISDCPDGQRMRKQLFTNSLAATAVIYCTFRGAYGKYFCDFARTGSGIRKMMITSRHWSLIWNPPAADLCRRRVSTIFIGSGTPACFPVTPSTACFTAIRTRITLPPDAEVTGSQPLGTAEAERFAAYRAAGVNRLSLRHPELQSVT